jgi:hypothetical protein
MYLSTNHIIQVVVVSNLQSALRVAIVLSLYQILVLRPEPTEITVLSETPIVVHASQACGQHEEGHTYHYHHKETGQDELTSVVDGPSLE